MAEIFVALPAAVLSARKLNGTNETYEADGAHEADVGR